MGHSFCRSLLRDTMKVVRLHTTAEQRKAAWAYRAGLLADQVEFHGPDEFYWTGTADCLYYARALGWNAWLRHVGVADV